ncbi:hypothetical protein OFM21_33550, partial [Escherichia coli]|nr:hypothetical protein [Escherichia coli]
GIQQQIQLLAAESRSIDEQSRQLQMRRERLTAEAKGLAAPDDARLAELHRQHEQAAEAQAVAEERLHELTELVPQLDED